MDPYSTTRQLGLLVRIENLAHKAGMTFLFSPRGPIIFSYVKKSSDVALRRLWHLFFFSILHVGEGTSTIPSGWYIVFPYLSKKESSLVSLYYRLNRLSDAFLHSVKKVKIHA